MYSTFGALTGLILAGPRVYLAMARDGLAFRWIGAIHPARQTPHLALALQAAWASVLVATGTFRTLFSLVIYTEWIFFALLAVGLMRLRRRPEVVREYRIPGYPVLPLVFVVAALGVVVNQVLLDPTATALGLGLVLLGLPVYHLWARNAPPPEALS
jgi:APA family basic amino acid/polyamine antiporter